MVRFLFLLSAILTLVQPAAVAAVSRDDSIERYARTAPEAAATSIQSLSGYLSQRARTDRERALAIYCWVATHIDYDAARFGPVPSAEEVLSARRAVCEGYAVLFQALAQAAGLEAKIIHGEAKGEGPAGAVGPDGLVSHAWNAVRIDGDWRLVDVTFGAGRRENGGPWVRHYTRHYFLTSPAAFGYDHLPEEPRWQLIEPTVSRERFLRRVKVLPPFFEYGLDLLGREEGLLEAGDSVQLRLGAPKDTLLVASVAQGGRPLGNGYAFAQREGDTFLVQAAFPTKGRYTLRVFVQKRGSGSREFDCAAEYSIRARRGTWQVFPQTYGAFQERECRVQEPLAGVLPAGKAVRFVVFVPGAVDVRAGASGPEHPLSGGDSGAFVGWVPVDGEGLLVYARFPGARTYEGLLRYRAH